MPGRTIAGADAEGPSPTLLRAATLTVYAFQFVRPLIEHVIVGAVAMQDCPPGFAVASYEVIGGLLLPTLDVGSAQETLTTPSVVAAVAMTSRGAAGTVMIGVAENV